MENCNGIRMVYGERVISLLKGVILLGSSYLPINYDASDALHVHFRVPQVILSQFCYSLLKSAART